MEGKDIMIELRNGHRVFATSYGAEDHPAILLIHDISRHYHQWEDQVNYLVAKGYRVIVTDLLGIGRSERVTSLNISDWHVQIIDVLDFYMINEVTIITLLSSSQLGVSLRSEYPKRITRVINVLPLKPKRSWWLFKTYQDVVKRGADALEASQERVALQALQEGAKDIVNTGLTNVKSIVKEATKGVSVKDGVSLTRNINPKDIHQWLLANSDIINTTVFELLS